MTVYANGLEVACKAQANKVIAAFPYVCMTPPQTPATPPGVPVPYPTFGLDSDTDSGTSTVKIGSQTVTQKNLSYYTRCTGNEAGCAPMKNVISHVNTGKDYAHAWSGNVKMDGEPVNRFSDLSTNDHASPQAGGPPYPKIGRMTMTPANCAKVLADFKLSLHAHTNSQCKETENSEHFMENQFMQDEAARGGVAGTFDQFKNYNEGDAPCICMDAYKKKKGVERKNWPTEGTDHHAKSADVRAFIKDCKGTPTIGEALRACCEAVIDNHRPTAGLRQGNKSDQDKAEQLMHCLETAFIEHLVEKINERRAEEGKRGTTPDAVRNMKIGREVSPEIGKMWK
jgi:hypothetical protein